MVPYPRELLNSVFVVETGNTIGAWAVGHLGQIIYYDGEVWSKVSSPTVNNLNPIFMLSDLQEIAVGDRETMI